jgi:outer membrane lipoprotein SlyB
MRQLIRALACAILLGTVFGCSEPLTTREKTAGVGTVAGSTLGAAIGSTVGHPGIGGVAGAGLGLGVGAVIGGQVEALEKKRNDLDQKIKQCELELQRLCEELEKLKNELQER